MLIKQRSSCFVAMKLDIRMDLAPMQTLSKLAFEEVSALILKTLTCSTSSISYCEKGNKACIGVS